MSDDLVELFPAAFTQPESRRWTGGGNLQNVLEHRPYRTATRPISTRVRTILSLALRGFDNDAIARTLKLSRGRVNNIVRSKRYLEYRDAKLDEMDSDFLGMKPLAFQALRGGLKSSDETTALRASEQWMKAAGFMQYGRSQGPTGVTAEDVAAKLLQVNVNVNVEK